MNDFTNNVQKLVASFDQIKIIPVLALDSVSSGLKLCEMLVEGGLPAAEITFRTAAAEETIRQASREFPQLTLGAGTVLSPETLERAIDAGAKFAVAPGFNPTVVAAAVAKGFPFAPGVCTPSEIEQAFQMGCTFLKFFPAEPSGGVKMLQAFLGPYRHLGVRFMPTGGVNPGNVESYLSVKEICAVGGTWLAQSKQIAAAAESNDWSEIAALIAQAAEVAAKYSVKA